MELETCLGLMGKKKDVCEGKKPEEGIYQWLSTLRAALLPHCTLLVLTHISCWFASEDLA